MEIVGELLKPFWKEIWVEHLDVGDVEMFLIWETVDNVMEGGRDGSFYSFLDNFINSSINNKVIFLCEHASSLK